MSKCTLDDYVIHTGIGLNPNFSRFLAQPFSGIDKTFAAEPEYPISLCSKLSDLDGTEVYSEFANIFSKTYAEQLTTFVNKTKIMISKKQIDRVYISMNGLMTQIARTAKNSSDADLIYANKFSKILLSKLSLNLDLKLIVQISASCSTGAVMINQACRLIKNGVCRNVLLIGLEPEISKDSLAKFNDLGVLSKSTNPEKASSPFSMNRSGMVNGEALVSIILTSEENSKIELLPGINNTDYFNLTAPEPSGKQSIKCILDTLIENSLTTEDIDLVCCHATGTVANDEIEYEILKSVFGNRSKPIFLTALKPYIGHTLHSSSLAESVICSEMLINSTFLGINNESLFNHSSNLTFITNTLKTTNIKNILKISFAFGGINSAFVIKK